MLVTPAARRTRPVALVTPGYRSLRVQTRDRDTSHRGDAAVHQALAELAGHAVYVEGGLLGMLHSTGADRWTATTWKGRATRLQLDGCRTVIYSLRGMLDGSYDKRADLLCATDWLAEQGVWAAGLSSMAWSLWRHTLDEPITLAGPPSVGHAALYGGRQEVREARAYQHMAAVDLSSAYPCAMASRPIAATLREVSTSMRLDPERAGLAKAKVMVPMDLPHAPLPVRVSEGAIQWRWGMVEGTWTWGELAAARELGCDVKVERNFAPMEELSPFGRWYEVVSEGRQLPGFASVIVKGVANALWGMFGMSGDHKAVVRWADEVGEYPLVVERPNRRMPQASTAHVAAEVTSRVRCRLLEEGMYGMPADTVHVDTDGVIVRRSAAKGLPKKASPGEWRIKTQMAKIEIRAPQVYRYKCDQECCDRHFKPGNWHYVTAGVTGHHAADLFEKVDRPSRVAILDVDMVLPPTREFRGGDVRASMAEGRLLRSSMFGVPLDSKW